MKHSNNFITYTKGFFSARLLVSEEHHAPLSLALASLTHPLLGPCFKRVERHQPPPEFTPVLPSSGLGRLTFDSLLGKEREEHTAGASRARNNGTQQGRHGTPSHMHTQGKERNPLAPAREAGGPQYNRGEGGESLHREKGQRWAGSATTEGRRGRTKNQLSLRSGHQGPPPHLSLSFNTFHA